MCLFLNGSCKNHINTNSKSNDIVVISVGSTICEKLTKCRGSGQGTVGCEINFTFNIIGIIIITPLLLLCKLFNYTYGAQPIAAASQQTDTVILSCIRSVAPFPIPRHLARATIIYISIFTHTNSIIDSLLTHSLIQSPGKYLKSQSVKSHFSLGYCATTGSALAISGHQLADDKAITV